MFHMIKEIEKPHYAASRHMNYKLLIALGFTSFGIAG